ncbi:MAG: (Fe-S)-binding protein [Polyangiaceae bacterium]
MPRPDDRPLRRLPTLGARKDTLEKCVFCPKLCRSACPVSNAEPRETLTPWGKMSTAYFAARGDVPLEEPFARPAWACTGCFACRASCDHENDVAGTLLDARAALLAAKLGPEGAHRTVARFDSHREATKRGIRELGAHAAVRSGSREALLVGCGYVRGAPAEARHAIDAAAALVRGPVALVDECCGLPMLLAGDAKGFALQAEAFAQRLKGVERVLVVDAGCALALRVRYREHGVSLDAKVELVVELAAQELASLRTVADANDKGSDRANAPVRWHDPCQLGRGLGVYEAPRAVLTRALGRAPDEFDTRRERGTCSGGGGLLPVTMPETSRTIAETRLAEHARSGGGRVVTACASSLLSMRKAGGLVDDIVTWIARAAPPPARRGPG